MTVKILAISDVELPQMHNVPYLQRKFADVDLVVSCGDLPAAYIEFVTTMLSLPLLYVRGNHDQSYAERPPGGDNLHKRVIRFKDLRFAGLEGSRRYNRGTIQYDEAEMLFNVLSLAPGMVLRRLTRGAGVDVMVTHAPLRYIHDRDDVPHQGFRVFRWMVSWFRPRYLIHGHVDVWDRRETIYTEFKGTHIININPVYLLELE